MSTETTICEGETTNGHKVFTLCGTSGCCPTITLGDNGEHTIVDDFGGTVRLTQEQFDLLLIPNKLCINRLVVFL